MGSERRAWLARALAAVAMMSAAACGRISGLDDLYLDDAGAGAAASSADASSGSTSSAAASGGGGAAATTGSAGSASSAGGGGTGGAAETTYFDEVMADDPLAYWRLGEAMGIGTAVDESPNGLHGSYFGPLVMFEPGAIVGDSDKAIHFPQVCSAYPEEKGVDVGDESMLEFTGTAAFTLELWIRPTCMSGNGQRRLLEKSDLNDPAQGYTLYRREDTGQLFFYRRGATDSDYVEGPAVVPPLDEWSYVAVVYDGVKLRMFVNNSWGLAKNSGVAILATTAKFRIGVASNNNFAFAGRIDEVAVYGQALPENRILAHYNKGKGLP
jgi:hypothetical protein